MNNIKSRYNELYEHFNKSGLSSKEQMKYFGHDTNKDRAVSYTAREFGIKPDDVIKKIMKG